MSLLGRFAFLGGKSERRRRTTKTINKYDKSDNPYIPSKIKSNPVPKQLSNLLRHSDLGFDGKLSDFEWVGDDLHNRPKHHHTRFLFLNCNGLPRKDVEFFNSFIRSCLGKHVHYCGLAEINFNAYNYNLKKNLNKGFENTLPGGLLHFNNSKIYGNQIEFQPGGVSAWLHGKLVRHYMTVGFDPLGRWIYHQFQGQTSNLRVYTLYRVNPGRVKKGSQSAWEQQRLLLSEKKIYTDPRKQVILDLCQEIQKAKNMGFEILLMGDLNESVGAREKTNDIFAEMDLINIFHTRCYTTPRTFRHGSQTIDHVWATPKLFECVQAAGFAPFNYFTSTDHRALVLDIDFRKFFMANTINLPQRISKLLKATNPKRISKYSEELEKRCNHMKITKKWYKIKEKLRDCGPTEEIISSYYHLDELITEAMLQSEDNSTLINRSEGDPWSLKYDQAIKKIYEWGYHLREANRLFRKGQIDNSVVERCKDGQDLASAELKSSRAKAKFLRTDFQAEQSNLLREQMKLRGHKGENYISTISQREKQIEQHSRIQNVLKKKFGSSVLKILIPSESEYPPGTNIFDVETIWSRVHVNDGKDISDWREITNRHMIEKLLLQWQQRHFQQALETPLAAPNWNDLLSKREIQEKILNGTFDAPEELPYECSLLLHFMQQTVPSQIDHRLSFEEFTTYIRNADEKTSCSPSGRHYGHYKALLITNKQLLFLIYDMFTTSLEYEIILPRWAKTVTTLIEKIEGVPMIHKFRTIHIVEAELQFFSKNIFARKMMKAAETANAISDNQYGGRKNRQATSVVLNKLLYYGICRQKLLNVAFMDDDAKACFDRIIPHLSQIESQKWGVHYKAAKLATKIIRNQQFFVKTGHGISTNSYSYSDASPIFGVGQGLGWSGPMWLNTSDTICKLLDQECGGMKFSSVDNSITVEKKNDHFVDDASSGVTANKTTLDKSIPEQLEHDEQKHSYSLFGSGHRLALHKCKWYYVCYIRHLTGYTFKPESESPASINLKEGFTTSPTTVPRLSPDCPHKTLGHWISPMGTSEKQCGIIAEKAQSWSNKIGKSSLQRDDRILAYQGYLMPSIRYKIVSTNLTFAECDKLMTPIKPILLNTHGLHKNCNRNILFLPTQNTGLGYQHWYIVKGIEKLRLAFLHFRKQDTTNDLLKICLSYTQLEIGNTQVFFSRDPSEWRKYVSDNWIIDLWQFTHECGVTLHLPDVWTYTPPRDNDVFLADLIEQSNWDETHKLMFHQIRLYLQLLTLSDLVVVDKGTQILHNIFQCTRSRDSSLEWPDAPAFPSSWKHSWCQFLRNTIATHLYHSPLGKWISPTHQKWATFTTYSQNIVRINNECFTKIQGQWKKTSSPTLCLYPCDFEQGKIKGYIKSLPTSCPHDQVETTYDSVFSTLPNWQIRNLGFIPTMDQLQKLAKLINSNECIGVSDGSLRDHYPAHAWCFVNSTSGAICIQGEAPVDGPTTNISSFRAEGMGLIAMLTLIDVLRSLHLIHSSTIKLYSDGESVIKKCRKSVESRSQYMLQNDIEVVIELRRLLQKNKKLVSLLYVPGHQDKSFQLPVLPLPTQLNILMDDAVRCFIENFEDRPSRHDIFPPIHSANVYLISDGSVLTHDIENTLHHRFYQEKWMHYSSDRFNLCNFTRPLVAWESIGKAIRSCQHSRGLSVKLIHNQHATNERHQKWRLLSHSNCPLCETARDTRLHVFRCSHQTMSTKQKNLRVKLIKLLDKMDTPPMLSKVILLFYDHWDSMEILQEKLDKIPEKPRILVIAIATQIDIGCDSFLLGLLSSSFGLAFEELWDPYQGHRSLSAQQWTTKIIKQILSIFRELWTLRCSIQKDEDVHSLEQAYRRELLEFCQQSKQEWWKFSSLDRHLVSVGPKYFHDQPLATLQIWQRQVQVAMTSAHFQAASLHNDIRQFFPTLQRSNRSRATRSAPLIPTQVLYKQSTLTSIPAPRTLTPAPAPTRQRKSFTKFNPISQWLVKKSARIRPVIPSTGSSLHTTSITNTLFNNNVEGVTSRLAVGTSPTLKIKNLIN